MSRQHDITHGMRSILVDWLVEVSDEFNLNPQTLYQAVSITDRFLSTTSVLRAKLQLVGSTSVYIASKLEEIYPPEIGEFAYITDDTYTKREVSIFQTMLAMIILFGLSDRKNGAKDTGCLKFQHHHTNRTYLFGEVPEDSRGRTAFIQKWRKCWCYQWNNICFGQSRFLFCM